MLKFSDGVEIDPSGPLRIIHLKDGYYVVGENMCIPVDSHIAAVDMIKLLKASSK